jgi:hypothetical protein
VCFLVSNGVRQGGGGVLSQSLFNVYMDDLSSTMNDLNVGCYFISCMVSHLMYADYIVRYIIAFCQRYASAILSL